MVGTAIVREHPLTGDPLAVEPGNSPEQETHSRLLLLIGQYLDIGQPRGIGVGDMGFFMTSTTRTAEAPITSDPLSYPLKTGQLFGPRGSCRRAGPTGNDVADQLVGDSQPGGASSAHGVGLQRAGVAVDRASAAG